MNTDRKWQAKDGCITAAACGVLLLLASCEPKATNAPVVPLSRAHAHNDYRHARPLHDALAHGFTSVEADVFLVDGDLYVAHDQRDVTPERTLRALYLDPLRERTQQNGGRVYRDGPLFTLLIDIKSEAEATHRRLDAMLGEYSDVFTCFGPEAGKDGAVTAIVSGNRPFELMKGQKTRYAAYDGRLSDLDSDARSDLIAMISDNWGRNFEWRGTGEMPATERARLREIVRQAHRKGRKVRFWGTPDRPGPEREAVWRELLAADVDVINADDLSGLREFLLAQAGR